MQDDSKHDDEEAKRVVVMAHADGDRFNNDPMNLQPCPVDEDPDILLHRIVSSKRINDMDTQPCVECGATFLKMERSLCPGCVLQTASIRSAKGGECDYLFAFQALPGRNYKYKYPVVQCGAQVVEGHEYCAAHQTWLNTRCGF